MKKLISIFGPSTVDSDSPLYEQAEQLGAQLAEVGFVVVTGGYEGVMEAASKGARSRSGSAVGVTAEVYHARGREANGYLTKEVRVKSAVDQLMELLDIADAYIALGNSTGTLIEVMTAWDYMIKRFIPRKPLLLVGETWRSFLAYALSEPQFVPFKDIPQCCDSADEAIRLLEGIFGPQLNLPDLTIISS